MLDKFMTSEDRSAIAPDNLHPIASTAAGTLVLERTLAAKAVAAAQAHLDAVQLPMQVWQSKFLVVDDWFFFLLLVGVLSIMCIA